MARFGAFAASQAQFSRRLPLHFPLERKTPQLTNAIKRK
jgi:hypothetical protein